MAEDKLPLRVLIFGAGAIGTYLGCSLHLSGCDVVFVEKQPVAEELRKRGLHLSLPGQELAVRDAKIVASQAGRSIRSIRHHGYWRDARRSGSRNEHSGRYCLYRF